MGFFGDILDTFQDWNRGYTPTRIKSPSELSREREEDKKYERDRAQRAHESYEELVRNTMRNNCCNRKIAETRIEIEDDRRFMDKVLGRTPYKAGPTMNPHDYGNHDNHRGGC